MQSSMHTPSRIQWRYWIVLCALLAGLCRVLCQGCTPSPVPSAPHPGPYQWSPAIHPHSENSRGALVFDWQQFIADPNRPDLAQPAATTLGPFGVAAPTAGLDQSELIDYREIAELAGRLAKRKSEKHQQLGRAIAKALRGEPYCATLPGVRNSTLFQIAGEIVEAYPYCSPEPVAELFRISLDRLADAAPPGNPAPTIPEFVAMLVRHQGPKQQKYQSGQAIENAYQSALELLPQATQAEAESFGRALPAEAPGPLTGNPAVSGAAEAGLDYRSIIVAVDGVYYLRHPQGRVYTFRCGSGEALRLFLQRQFLDRGGLGVSLTDDRGDMFPNDQILRAYGSPAKQLVFDYSATLTEYDQRSMILRSGFTMATMPDLTTIEPEISQPVEDWLRALSGGTDDSLAELYDWIAATEQRYIRTNAAALVIIGPPSIGKNVLARALAHTWGQHEPAKFAYVLDRFNGVLASCPIWHADEETPADMSDSLFKEIVQEQQRYIELKGRERMVLVGCSRILITVNSMADVRIRSASGPDGVKACADRLAIFNADRARAEALLGRVRAVVADRMDPVAAERLLVARHLRWVQLNLVPRTQRFLGARADRSEAMVPILTATAEKMPAVFEAISDYLADPFSWEREYSHIEQIVKPGRRFPIVAQADRIYVCTQELMVRLGIREADRNRVTYALRPFMTNSKARLSFGAGEQRFRGYYVELDPERLEQATESDAVPALVPGTRARMIAAGLMRETL